MLDLDLETGPFSDKNISIKIHRVGQEHCDPKKRHERRRWDSYASLHFVLYGSGVLIANGEKLSLSKGDVFLLYVNQEYEYYPSPNDPWSYIWIDFYTNDLDALFSPCGLSPEQPYLHLSDLPSMMGLLKPLYEAYDASATQQLVCSAYFMLILSELIKHAARKNSSGETLSVKQRHVRNILTYIHNNFRLQLTTHDIAAQNHISVSRMMVLFSETIGMSPIAYLNCYRVSTACDLLRKTDASIGEIALSVGVEDRLYFSRMFKKWKGMSPREYRSNHSGEDPFAWLKERNIDIR